MTGSRREEIEAWWALVARVLAFFLGAVLAYNLRRGDVTSPFPYFLAAALMGPVIAASLAQIVRAFRGNDRR